MARQRDAGQEELTAAQSPSGALGRLRARLRQRPDTEHEQALVRLVNTALIILYLLPQDFAASVWAIYVLVAIGILVALLASPGVSPARRTLGVAADLSMLTWVLVQYGEHAAPLFLLYLWITLANGFRFGAQYLLISLGLSVAGFTVVLLFGDFWIQHRNLGIGLVVGLILLSLYVKKLVTQLFDALARAEAANVAKRRFISVVSHEMRTPLNAIIGMADLLRDTSLNREQADMLQTLRSSSRVMLGLVEDVLDFSKIEAGKVTLGKADFDLHAMVNSTCRILATQAAAKGVEFVVSIMPEVTPRVRGDAHYLRQILINLAGNAVKFTERGTVTVHVSTQEESDAAVRLKFSIRDTGIGIAPEAQAKIFESFTQADESTTRRFGGTGLGTTIAKQLVELMKGKIGLESAVGLGTTFWFEVELEKQAEHPGTVSGELAGERVLLVGFPETELASLQAALSGWGAAGVASGSLDEGIARLVSEISLAKPYHSVLLYAARHDGRLAERFRRAVPDPAPPAVLAVPREARVPRFEALSSGFNAILELPLEKRSVFNVLHSVSAGAELSEGVVRLQDYARRSGTKSRLKILVADDNPTNREVIAKILERGGMSAVVVNDGEQALDALEQERFDAVLLDRNMPGMGGIEAAQAIRLMTRGRERIPVMILSADATPEAKREALEAGADAFFPKPIEALRLLEGLQDAVARMQAQYRAEPLPALTEKRRAPAAGGELAVVNRETVGYLEELGSSPVFLEKLVRVFVADSTSLVSRMEHSIAARTYGEFRAHLHALKGSSASMGTDRLTQLCTSLGKHSDSELRLQGPGIMRSLSEELGAAAEELDRFLGERKKLAT